MINICPKCVLDMAPIPALSPDSVREDIINRLIERMSSAYLSNCYIEIYDKEETDHINFLVNNSIDKYPELEVLIVTFMEIFNV